MSTLHPELHDAYEAISFNVEQEKPFVLRVGMKSPELLDIFKNQNALGAAIISAGNPFSEKLSLGANAKRHRKLEEELVRRSLKFKRCIGQDHSSDWPGEASFLILDVALEASKKLAKLFDQDGFVWVGENGIPEVVEVSGNCVRC